MQFIMYRMNSLHQKEAVLDKLLNKIQSLDKNRLSKWLIIISNELIFSIYIYFILY